MRASDRERTLVVFDAGGVLVRICRTWAEGAGRAGVPAPEGVGAPEAVARRIELANLYQAGLLTDGDYFAQLASAIAPDCAPDIVQRVHDAWLIEEYPGVRGLIDDLHDAGVATALLSNTNARHLEAMLAPAGPFGAVGTLGRHFVSHELGACKPDAAIYEAVERAAGREGSQIVFFDDLEENVAAARARAWRAHQVDHEGDTAAQMRAQLRAHRLL